MPEERLIIVDEQNRVVGSARRSRVRRENLLHRGVAILVTNSAGEIYVHRRTDTKDVFPGLYDMFAGGGVAEGESYDETAVREAHEELGVTGAEIEYLFTRHNEVPGCRSMAAVYRVTFDGPIRQQPEEVAWGRFMSIEELDRQMEEWPFVPDGVEIFREYRSRCQP